MKYFITLSVLLIAIFFACNQEQNIASAIMNTGSLVTQEFFINTDSMIIISHSAYYYIMSESEKIRLRVMIFTKKIQDINSVKDQIYVQTQIY